MFLKNFVAPPPACSLTHNPSEGNGGVAAEIIGITSGKAQLFRSASGTG
jgi:hypothetical protein